MWVGTDSGLDKFTKPAVSTITSKQGLPEDLVSSVVTTPQGVRWVGTSSGLYRLDHDLATKSNLKFPDNNMGSLFESATGRMLVATGDPRGLVWLDGDRVSVFESQLAKTYSVLRKTIAAICGLRAASSGCSIWTQKEH